MSEDAQSSQADGLTKGGSSHAGVEPASREGLVSDAVFTTVAEEILSGRWQPGDALLPERELASAFEVNRHAVREALKRLQQAGLVRITHGDASRVLDWRVHAGLDVLSTVAAAGAIPPGKVMADFAVMRRAIASDAAQWCAMEADDEQRASITAAAAAFPEGGELSVLGECDVRFWSAVVDGSGNLAYRLALNTLNSAIRGVGSEAYNSLNAGELTDRRSHEELAEAIVAADVDAAGRLAAALLTRLVAASRRL